MDFGRILAKNNGQDLWLVKYDLWVVAGLFWKFHETFMAMALQLQAEYTFRVSSLTHCSVQSDEVYHQNSEYCVLQFLQFIRSAMALSLSSFRGRWVRKLQLDVCDHNQWWRHLLNAHEVEAGMVLFAGKTVWSMPERLKGCL